MHRLRVWCAATGLALGALALPTTASAQGFSVYEHSACAMGRAGATVADPCLDGSSMFFNPAG
ncbi:MAG: long-chain fatty acid transporter, partial [Gemmatimonadetes bacterium]|nr:long-chain fatty acid transporter [Gemmatimonadota bacterium]